ncbi:hypothetical protein [Rubeoparvulum massiliense]|nr:hypothetical protein [Rubeoparvulum massiliense]
MILHIFSLVIEIRVQKKGQKIKHYYPQERIEHRSNLSMEEIMTRFL